MDLQTVQMIYYTMGIIFMTLAFAAIIALIYVSVQILIKVNKMHKQINAILEEFKENPSGKASEILMSVGAGLANAGAKKVREMIVSKRR